LQLKNGNKSESKKWEEQAFKFAKKAIELDPKSMKAHKYCAAVGRMAPHVSTKERIQMGHEFKEHRDIAISIDNNDHLMHHMYGRWCMEVANLSFMERQIAKAFFGTPPESSFDEAFESLKMADKLKSEWKMNHLWIAKVLIALKKYSDAIQWIDSGLELSNVTEEDGVAQLELETLVKSYGKYRGK
ncbi:regulator of microtubule dynamics protein 2-like protein, partial [Euroglyphus maynei]